MLLLFMFNYMLFISSTQTVYPFYDMGVNTEIKLDCYFI